MKQFKNKVGVMIGLMAALVVGVGEAKEQRLVFSGYSGSTTLTDFQAMVKLTEGQYGFSYNDYAAKDGSDIWFTDWQGNVIPHEIDLWNASGASYIWVRVPELTGKSTSITMHWGETRTASQTAASSANVWKNNKDGRGGYVGVWHMGKATGAESEPDATGNGLDAVPYSETSSIGDMTAELNTGWPTGANRQNTGTNGHKNALKVPDYSRVITEDTRFTVSGWFRCSNAYNGNYKRFFSAVGLDGKDANNGWEVRQNGDGYNGNAEKHQSLQLSAYDGTTLVGSTKYKLNSTYIYNTVYMTVVFSDRVTTIYQNGVLIGSDNMVRSKARQSYLTAEQLENPVNDFGFLIGHKQGSGNSWCGRYDEVRMYDGAESADRVKANYDTMATPNTFLAMPANITGTAKVQQLKFAGYTGNEALTDFQVLVKLFEGQYGFSYDDYSVKDGSDIWFTDSDGNVLPHEIETWNPSGESFIWVRVPEITGPSSYILMHWGAERTNAAEIAASRANVWKNNGDGGYVGVWHIGNATFGESEPDSTGNGLHAAPYSETGHMTKMVKTASATTGFPTAGRQNAEAEGENNALRVPLYKQFVTDESRFTVSGWFRASNTSNSRYKRFFCAAGLDGANVSNGWEVRQNGDGRNDDEARYKTLALSVYDGTSLRDYAQREMETSYLQNAVYITVAFDGTKGYIYENGALQWSEDILACKARESYLTAEQLADPLNAYGFTIGCRTGVGTAGRAWTGHYDEIRMYDGAESATRIKANYDTMATPNDFLVTDTAIATAEWTDGGNDGNVANSANWLCKLRTGQTVENALPTVETDVTISGGDLYVDLSAGTAFSCRTVTFGNATLAQDNDWSGLDAGRVSFAQGTAVDLKGHNLTVAGFGGAGTITNSVDATTSVLTLDSGLSVNNSGTAVGGNVKFVKDGTGTFTSSKASTYTGGTEVDAGTIQAPLSTAAYDATFTPFGTGKITVNPNGTFNAQSTVAYRNNVILNGGTIKGGTGVSDKRPVVMLEKVTADSFMVHNSAFEIGIEGVTTDLEGHTVSVSIAGGTYFRWHGSLAGVSGKIKTTGGGYLNDFVGVPPGDGECLIDLDIESLANMGTPAYVHDYRAANPNNSYGSGAEHGIYVCGTYTPVGNYFYGCVLQDGATLDISARTLPFSLTSSLSNQSSQTFKRKTVRFDAGATVTVKINQGSIPTPLDKGGFRVVSWDETTKPGNDVKFILDDSFSSKYKLSPRDDGLWLRRHKGLVIFVM